MIPDKERRQRLRLGFFSIARPANLKMHQKTGVSFFMSPLYLKRKIERTERSEGVIPDTLPACPRVSGFI